MNLTGVAAAAAGEFRTAQLRNLYRRDFQAWKADVLGYRTYEKMEGIFNEALFGEKNRTVIKSSNGTAKDLALDTPLLTTAGWKTMRTVEVGDYVFSEEGAPIEVSWKSEVFNKPSYRVVFDDGSSLVTSDTHQWNTLTLQERGLAATKDWRDEWDRSSTRTTGEIAGTLHRGTTRNHLVPLARPLEYSTADLPMDPYVLGAWLGDGSSMRAEITCHYDLDGYVIDQVSNVYPMRHRKGTKYSYVAVLNADGPNRRTSQFHLDLKATGVLRNKRIPDVYMTASVEQRIALLRGLMDTDGYADKRGSSVAWAQSRPELMDQFCALLTSLGLRYSRSSHTPPIGQEAFVVRFTPTFDPFTPGERKSRTFTTSSQTQRSRMTGRVIVAVEPVESVPTQCIQVDSERHLYLAGDRLIPTHNSHELSSAVLWVGSVHEPGEAVSIVSAPSLTQVEKVIWKYLKSGRSRAEARGYPLAGFLNESLEWKVKTSEGNVDIAFGRKPAAGQEVSTFQGIRSEEGLTFVFFDEAGGMHKNMYTAAEAVLTGAYARFIGIGNPDIPDGEFAAIYKDDKKYADDWNRFTLSSFDLPTFTGEVVYPDDPAMEKRMLSALTQPSWVEHKKRSWGMTDARYLSKVLGEFPKDGGNGFFSQAALDKAYDTVIEDDASVAAIGGADIARFGQDESVFAVNRGGRVRVVDTWGKTDTVESARRIHTLAQRENVRELRIDSTGVGGGVFDMLENLDEFADKQYLLVGVDNGAASPDKKQWLNMRAYSHDSLRAQMLSGEIDLDIEDTQLKDEMLIITYKFMDRGGIRITPKADMKTEMGGSPDRTDAVILSVVDLSPWFDQEEEEDRSGKRAVDPEDILGVEYEWGKTPGMPL